MTRRRAPRIQAVAAPRRSPAVRTLVAVAMLAVLVAYANSFSNPFLPDDRSAVTSNERIRTLWPLSTPLSPPDETPMAGRPFVNLTFAVNYALGGLDVRGYHIGNLIIHLLAILVLLALVRRVLALPGLAPAFGAHATALAVACALIWGLHPLHTEIINYVSQRTTALMGLCYLLTLYCCLRAAEPPRVPWGAAAVMACAAGMASKEVMVTAPALVILFDRVFLFGSLREAARQRAGLYAGLAGTWAVLALLMLSGGRTTVGFNAGVSAWTYLLNQFPIIVRYLRLALWPDVLVVDYGVPQALELADVRWPVVVVASLVAGTIAALRFRPYAGFAGAAFFILLSPTSSVVPIASEVGAERRMYLPLAAIVVLAVCLVYRGASAMLLVAQRRLGWHPRRHPFYAGCAVVGIVCALMCARVASRNREYRSPLTIATVTAERRPHGRAYFALANALLGAGREADAISYFRRSSADFPGGRFALGTMLVAKDPEAGIAELEAFTREVPHHPYVPATRQLIGLAYLRLGRFAQAVTELRMAVSARPRDIVAHAALGEALFKTGHVQEALPHLQIATAAQPSGNLHNLLGAALAESGRLGEARAEFQRATRLAPHDPSAATNLEHLERIEAGRSSRRRRVADADTAGR